MTIIRHRQQSVTNLVRPGEAMKPKRLGGGPTPPGGGLADPPIWFQHDETPTPPIVNEGNLGTDHNMVGNRSQGASGPADEVTTNLGQGSGQFRSATTAPALLKPASTQDWSVWVTWFPNFPNELYEGQQMDSGSGDGQRFWLLRTNGGNVEFLTWNAFGQFATANLGPVTPAFQWQWIAVKVLQNGQIWSSRNGAPFVLNATGANFNVNAPTLSLHMDGNWSGVGVLYALRCGPWGMWPGLAMTDAQAAWLYNGGGAFRHFDDLGSAP